MLPQPRDRHFQPLLGVQGSIDVDLPFAPLRLLRLLRLTRMVEACCSGSRIASGDQDNKFNLSHTC